MIKIKLLTAEEVSKDWESIDKKLRTIINRFPEFHGDTTNFLAEFHSGIKHFWGAYENGVLITVALCGFHIYPQCASYKIFACAGRMFSAFDKALDELIKFAKRHGADMIEVVGRKGWEKLLSHHDFFPVHVTYKRLI